MDIVLTIPDKYIARLQNRFVTLENFKQEVKVFAYNEIIFDEKIKQTQQIEEDKQAEFDAMLAE